MANSSATGSRAGRVLTAGAGLIMVTGIVLAGSKNGAVFGQAAEKGSASAKASDAKGSGSAPAKDSSSGSGSSKVAAKEIKIPDMPRKGLHATDEEVVKFIDDKLAEAWKANGVQPAELCSDHEFIRRASLDIIGRVPRPDEMTAFFSHSESQNDKDDPEGGPKSRRAWFIDYLLKKEEYPKNWGNIWTNWLLTRSGGAFGRGKYHDQMRTWVEDKFAVNQKYNDFVKELISAKGKSTDDGENGAALFILAHVGEPTAQGKQQEEGQFDMVPITARITRLFLGIQTQCTQCHDHPFDKRLQSEFWGVNAFMRQAIRIGNPTARRGQLQEDLELRDSGNNKNGTVFYEKRNGVVLETGAVFLDGKKPAPGANRREELAKFVVEHDSFQREIVNRMWGHFFAKGFVNPIDDFNSKNEVNHPELFEELSGKFKHYGYDLKKLIRWICNSRAYNLKSVANATNDKPEQEVLFSRMALKAFSPEQLFESLMVATDAEAAKDKKEKNKLKEQWMNRLVSNFGDDEGNEVSFSGTVVQALLMMNGEDINTAITSKDGTVAKIVKKNGPLNVQANVTDLYLVTLNRKPTDAELKKVAIALPLVAKKDKDPNAPWQDLMWALLNSNEFILNH